MLSYKIFPSSLGFLAHFCIVLLQVLIQARIDALEYWNSSCRDYIEEIDWDREAIFREYASRGDAID